MQGLYEFRVMPFVLTNAPAIFQQLIQKVLAGLNPEDGHDFVTAYIDDILVFSPTLTFSASDRPTLGSQLEAEPTEVSVCEEGSALRWSCDHSWWLEA